MLTYFLFTIGFIFLVKGADFLVDGASALARMLNVSDLIIGLAIVAFGTSAPEFVVNIFANFQGDSGIAIGNILGSNIANILLILGISAIIFTMTITNGIVWKQIPLTLLAGVVLGILANDKLLKNADNPVISRLDGMVMLLFFVGFVFLIVKGAMQQGRDNKEKVKESLGLKKATFLVIMGLLGLNLGAKWVVARATSLAEALGASDMLIGLTIVAMVTSLPELVTSITAALRKNADIAVGNIVGSNIFNIFLILGVSSHIRPIPFQSSANIDIGITIMNSLLLFIAMFIGKKEICFRGGK